MFIPANFTSEILAALGGPDWLRAARARAAASLTQAPWPTDEEEVWRYSRIADLDIDAYGPAPAGPSGDAPGGEVTDLLDAIGERAALVMTWNGSVVRTESSESPATKGLVVTGADDWSGDMGFDAVAGAADAFGLLNEAYAPAPIYVDIPAGVFLERPIVVVHWVASDDISVLPRLMVRAGEASEATVCEIVASPDIDALVAPVTHIDVAAASNLHYVNLQMLGPRVWQVGYQASRVERDATFSSTSVALGGDYARVRTDSKLVGVGATSRLRAVYFGDDSQVHDFRTLQDHDAPKTTSDLLFKGAVGGRARSVYSGLIRVRAGAAGTTAFQTNRNLVLSDGAHADSVPNLEIEENDVRCSHASAVGPVDEDQLYYLESRGVPTPVAERLIVLGFLQEVVSSIPIDGLSALLRQVTAGKLNRLEDQLA